MNVREALMRMLPTFEPWTYGRGRLQELAPTVMDGKDKNKNAARVARRTAWRSLCLVASERLRRPWRRV